MTDRWASGEAYEPYVGRWSALVAAEFVEWLGVPTGKAWLDFGCGTGALARTILRQASPASVKGLDRSEAFIGFARDHVRDSRIAFEVGSLESMPDVNSFDVIVSGLVINFLPDPAKTLAEMKRLTRTGGIIAAYVWDYAGRMDLMRYFWDAATALDKDAARLDEGPRFPLCNPGALQELFTAAGLDDVRTRAIDVQTRFADFDDYWMPFLGGQGPAPGYAMSLSEERRGALRERIRASLPVEADGSIDLAARAWAILGKKV